MVVIIQNLILIPLLIASALGIGYTIKQICEIMAEDGEEDVETESNG